MNATKKKRLHGLRLSPISSKPEVANAIQAVNNVIVTVQKSNEVAKSKETFITQKGGKIIQGLMEIQSQEQETLLQDRRSLQSTLLLQRKKEMQSVQEVLDKRRLEFAKRMEECREKQDELRAKQKQIKDRVFKFEKFLKENDAKRIRANAKALLERKQREQKEIELSQIQKQFQAEQAKSAQILIQIKRHEGFERYLQSIVDALPPDYLDVHEPQINDVLMRYKTLTETNMDLFKDVRGNQDLIEQYQAKLGGLVKEKNDMVMVYNSQVAAKQKMLDKLRLETAYAEEELELNMSLGKERMRILSETKLAIDDLYERTKDQNKKTRVLKVEPALKSPEDATGSSAVLNKPLALALAPAATNDEKKNSFQVKLSHLQYRVLDLQNIILFDAEGAKKKRNVI